MDNSVKENTKAEPKTIRREAGRLDINSDDICINSRVIEALLKAGYELDSKVKYDNNNHVVGEELTVYAKVTFYM